MLFCFLKEKIKNTWKYHYENAFLGNEDVNQEILEKTGNKKDIKDKIL